LLAFVLALLPAVVLLGIVSLSLAAAGIDTSGMHAPQRDATLDEAFWTVVLAPAVETLVLAGGLKLLSKLTHNRAIIVTSSAIVWGCLHALFGVLRFFPAGWMFFVLSCSYLAWRPSSFRQAFAAAAIPHALVNLSAFTLIAYAKHA
jgi:hypothetical protein